jgi:hypothetical protein
LLASFDKLLVKHISQEKSINAISKEIANKDLELVDVKAKEKLINKKLAELTYIQASLVYENIYLGKQSLACSLVSNFIR